MCVLHRNTCVYVHMYESLYVLYVFCGCAYVTFIRHCTIHVQKCITCLSHAAITCLSHAAITCLSHAAPSIEEFRVSPVNGRAVLLEWTLEYDGGAEITE